MGNWVWGLIQSKMHKQLPGQVSHALEAAVTSFSIF